jgi:hypothetical protein
MTPYLNSALEDLLEVEVQLVLELAVAVGVRGSVL